MTVEHRRADHGKWRGGREWLFLAREGVVL